MNTPIGGTLLQAAVSVVSYAGIAVASVFDKTIREDMDRIGWKIFNDNEELVDKSKKVSFYKGVPVFRTDTDRGSLSLGIICLDTDHGAKELMHERGHNTQFMHMGLGTYLVQIGLPSITNNDDFSAWELSASILGESSMANGASITQENAARAYFPMACIPGINIITFIYYLHTL